MHFFENCNRKCLNVKKFNVFELNGCNFSILTKNHFQKPFDNHFHQAMKKCAEELFIEFHFDLSFVGNDEIYFIYYPFTDEQINNKKKFLYNGNLFKFLSIIPSLISSYFTKETGIVNSFDCKHFEYDEEEQIKNYLKSKRTNVIKKNKINFLQHLNYFKKLDKMSLNEIIQLIENEKNINYYKDIDEEIRNGLFLINVFENKRIKIKKYDKQNDKLVETNNYKEILSKKTKFELESDMIFNK